MMSSFFKNLTRGVKFNTNRFLDDAVKLQIVKDVPTEKMQNFPGAMINSTENGIKRKHDEIKIEQDLTEDDQEEVPVKKKVKKDKVQSKQHLEEQLKHFRKTHKIHIWGFDIPKPVEEFSSIPNITQQLLYNIKKCGYEVPTAVQMQAIPVLMQDGELAAFAATGSGKTAAYLIPIILHCKGSSYTKGVKVIVSPTRELAAQIYRECLRLSDGIGVKIFNLAGKDAKLSKKNKKINILITTPNRLVYSLKQGEIDGESVDFLIVDECDNLFEEGFQDQIGFIYSSCQKAKHAFFSATCSYQVEQFCKAHLDNHITVFIGSRNSAVDVVEQSLIYVGTEQGKLLELRDTIKKGIQAPVLIFVQSQDRADELFKELQAEKGLKVGLIHSGKNETQRMHTIEEFRLGNIWLLITTALLSRGMDFIAVRTVINYDMPCSTIQYIHSIGRTGRAGKSGKAITFFTEDDKENLRKMGMVLANAGFPVPDYLFKLKKSRKQVNLIKRDGIGKGQGFNKNKSKRNTGKGRDKNTKSKSDAKPVPKENTLKDKKLKKSPLSPRRPALKNKNRTKGDRDQKIKKKLKLRKVDSNLQ